MQKVQHFKPSLIVLRVLIIPLLHIVQITLLLLQVLTTPLLLIVRTIPLLLLVQTMPLLHIVLTMFLPLKVQITLPRVPTTAEQGQLT